MPSINVVVESKVSRSPRARQLEGMFDVPAGEKQRLEWDVSVPIEEEEWNVGLIVGPSGSGKSTVAKALFGDSLDAPLKWSELSVIDDFRKDLSVKDIAAVCSSVGFNTIPAWLRPYEVLSNGEKFRVSIARKLLEQPDPVVVDEFTSVIDRQVAQIGCHAIQKKVRKDGRKFVGVACHYDIIDWLQPDWVYEPAANKFYWRSLRQRPEINIEITRVHYSAWRIFAPYHYMSADLNKSCRCYCLFVDGAPAAFAGVINHPHAQLKNLRGVSRLVTLPDFQGLGLAFVLLDFLGAKYKKDGMLLHMYPAHPSLTRSLDRSPKWQLRKKPGRYSSKSTGSVKGQGGRPCAVFRYVGPSE